MWLKYLLDRPIAVCLTFAVLISAGILTVNRIPVSLLPQVEIPEIQVKLSYPNASARQLENAIVQPIRNQLLQVAGVKDVWSTSEDGYGHLTLFFDFGQPMKLAYLEVNEKLDQVLSQLPKDMERPLVIHRGLGDLPVLYLSMVPPQDREEEYYLHLSSLCHDVIKRRLEQLPQVSLVDMHGFAEPELLAIPDYDKMQALGLELNDISQVIEDNNVKLSNLQLRDGHYQYQVRFLSEIRDADELAEVRFNHHGQVVKLSDIVRFEYKAQTPEGIYRYNNQRAVLFSIRKQANARLLSLNKEVKRTVADLNRQYPQLRFHTHRDQSELIKLSISNLVSSMGYGCLFAILILFVAYRSPGTVFLIAVVIPGTLLTSLVFFYLSGLSVNIISLSGLILGVGLMIDNSIIIIDNIRQHLRAVPSIREACARGVNEILAPLLSSMLTTCSVFLPLLFLSGISGALFYDQAIAISIALLVSLALAAVLIPVLSLVLKVQIHVETTQREQRWAAWHENFMFPIIYRKGVIILGFLLLAIAGCLAFWKCDKSSFPNISRNGLEVELDWNQPLDMHIQETLYADLIHRLDPYVENSEIIAGISQFKLENEAQSSSQARLIFYQSDPILREQLSRELTSFFSAYPLCRYSIIPLRNAFDAIFSNTQNKLYLLLRPYNLGAMNDSWQDLQSMLEELAFEDLHFEPLEEKQILHLSINRRLTNVYNIEQKEIESQIKLLLGRYSIGELFWDNQALDIRVSPPTQDFFQGLQQLSVKNKDGASVPLKPFLEVNKAAGPAEIQATQLGEAWRLKAQNPSRKMIAALKAKATEDPRYEYRLAGSWLDNQEQIQTLINILLIAIVLLFFILSMQFESIRLPFVVIGTIPFGVAGSLVFLFLTGQSINIISIIGMVVMAGIMINDAILKVDMIQKGEAKGLSRKEAIHMAGKRRIKAILMTSATTILALIPILIFQGLGADLQRPLAIAVIGGLMVGTISSLLLLPVLYQYIVPCPKLSTE